MRCRGGKRERESEEEGEGRKRGREREGGRERANKSVKGVEENNERSGRARVRGEVVGSADDSAGSVCFVLTVLMRRSGCGNTWEWTEREATVCEWNTVCKRKRAPHRIN